MAILSSVVQSEIVGPAQAQAWLLECPYEHQRTIRPKRIEYLAREMETGRFMPNTIISFAAIDDKWSLLNGQHTLNAIVKSGCPQTLAIARYRVDKKSELGKLYSRIDRQMQRRLSEMYAASEQLNELNMTPTRIDELGRAARTIMCNLRTTKSDLPFDEVEVAMVEYAPWAKEYQAIAEGLEHRMRESVLRCSTMAPAILTLRYAVKKMTHQSIVGFWKGVMFNDGLTRHDPARELHYFLRDSVRNAGHSGGGRKMYGHLELVYAVSRCWNCWVKGEKVMAIHFPDKVTDIELLNTPFSKSWKD